MDATTFPILDELVFFNHAGVAPISGPAAAALRGFADHAASRAYVGAGWQREIKRVKERAAGLIGAGGGHEIAFVPNTSTGIALMARGLDWQPGDQVLITNVEYPANRYPWVDLERLGVEVKEVAQRPDGRIAEADVIAAITERTRVVAISHVQYASGHRIDPRPIAQAVHAAGGLLFLDAIQSVGTMPLDVADLGADALAADGHKWLLGPEGCGIFYCRAELIPHLHPAVVGWMNMVEATNFGEYRFELQPDARRFEPGSYNVPGILALGASIDLLIETGLERVWGEIEALTARLCAGLAERGYRVFSPRATEAERSALVVFEPPAGAGMPEAIAGGLAADGIHIVPREGRLRASPHFYNTDEQVEKLLAALPAGA